MYDYYSGSSSSSSRPPPKEDVFNGKRMRKPVIRRGVDYFANMLNFSKRRKFRRDFRDDDFVQWDLDEPAPTPAVVEGQANPQDEKIPGHPEGAKRLLPPFAMEHSVSSSCCTRFSHTSINKARYPINCLTFFPDGKRVITGSSSGEFTLWNANLYSFETILQAHDTAVRTLMYSHSDAYLLSGDHAGLVKYWQPNFNCVKIIHAHEQPVREACFAPTDLKFATCADDGLVKIWDFMRAEMEVALEGHGWDVKTLDWDTSRSLIASGGKDSKIKFWEPRLRKELHTLHAHKQAVQRVKWNRNGNWLLTASRDNNAKLFDIRTMKELMAFRGHKRDLTCCAWHPFHEGMFVTGSSDACINFYSVGYDLPIARIDGAHDSNIWDLAWHPMGHEIATASNDQMLRFWIRNRPSDKLDDHHNATARLEGNVDPARLVRAPPSCWSLGYYDVGMVGAGSAQGGPGAASAVPGINMAAFGGAGGAAPASANPPGVNLPVGFGGEAPSALIPGMSGTQARFRKQRTVSVAPTAPSRSKQPANATIMVASYDMLAQTNAIPRNFAGVSESLLQWSYRSQSLLLELKQFNADVLCLQELSFYREFWQQNLKGYQVAFQAHADPNVQKGVAIMTRPQKLALREAQQVRFTDEAETWKSLAIIGVYEAQSGQQQQQQQHQKHRSMFVIASVQLSNYGNEEKQLQQARVLVASVERIRTQLLQTRENMVHVLMCGNFNTVPGSAVYNFLMSNATAAPTFSVHTIPLGSAYFAASGGREPPFTTIAGQWEGCTDYMFYSHSELGLKDVIDVPPRDMLVGGIPNKDYSSNHLSLAATFSFLA